jgi:hypothetical protein
MFFSVEQLRMMNFFLLSPFSPFIIKTLSAIIIIALFPFHHHRGN